jgi:hypothetical protein
MADRRDGDSITVGNITGAQGVAIGRNARAQVPGQNVSGDAKIDAKELRATLEQLYDELAQMQLPREQTRSAQTAAGNALDATKEDQVEADTVVQSVKRIGETLKQANVAVAEGSTMWQTVQKLAPLLGPLVGGARIVTGWFGLPL